MAQSAAMIFCQGSYVTYKTKLAEFADFILEEKSENAREAILANKNLRKNYLRACAREFERYCEMILYAYQVRSEIKGLIKELDSACRKALSGAYK